MKKVNDFLKMTALATAILSASLLTGCGSKATNDTGAEATASQKTQSTPAELPITTVTEANYPRAETQLLTEGYIKKIAAATNSDGVGVLWNIRQGSDPKDRTIPRTNYDTIYTWAVLDLTEDATLVMPETNGRYQTTWFMTEEHYNPMVMVKAGTYTLTQKDMGSRYVVMVIRTQANTESAEDLAAANAIQDGISLSQKDKGIYAPQYRWNKDEVIAMRTHFQDLAKDKGITSELMFGKKGEQTTENHNAGTAVGWGGFTPEQAVYPLYYPTSTAHQTLTLKNVPTNAFWSATVYDKGGYAVTDTYNINSQFADTNEDGSVTINFGGDKNAKNYMEAFEGWNITLRIYLPTEAYFNGEWTQPELVLVK
jgi:hypothetical protein